MLDIKMKHASLFLRTTDKNIDEISCLVGFNSTSYFIKVFKEYYNTTPKNIMAFILLHKEHCHKFLLEIFKILFAMSTRNEEQFERRERSSF